MLNQLIKFCVFQRWDYGKTLEKSAELDLICLTLMTSVQRIILLLYHQVPFHHFKMTTCYNIHYLEILICTWLSFPLACCNNFLLTTVLHGKEARIAVSIQTGFRLDGRGLIPSRAKEICFYSTASRPALRPTHPPIWWVLGAISPEVKWPENEADHSLPSSDKIKNGGAIPPLPIAWCLIH
jgi:hypothetical protein